jgi:hypothetical protein
MRVYSVTMQSQGLPIAFNIVTVPAISDAMGTPVDVLQSLTLRLQDDLSGKISADLALNDLVELTLSKSRKRNARGLRSTYADRSIEFREFTSWVASQEFVPVENSPLRGASLDSLTKSSSLVGFASFAETWGLVHHDPVLCIVALPMTIVIGVTVGAGEGLQDRVKMLLGAANRRRKKRKRH